MSLPKAPTQPRGPRSYFGRVFDAVGSTAKGMALTMRYLLRKPVTIRYPEEQIELDNRYRGIHYLEQDLCIYCDACAKACPVDCIEMDANRHGKEIEWKLFQLDYQKCMFCELCIYPCPKDCIHMGKEYSMVSENRSDFMLDLLSWTGLTEEQKVRVQAAEQAKAAKKAAKAAAKAVATQSKPEDSEDDR
jgi:NADH-quinone oxidoreductase subunit I